MADLLTPRAACEIVSHEAIVQEWYLDSSNIGTWGVGVTNASGHRVDRYKNNPATIEECLAVYCWLLRNRYIPDVMHAFGSHQPTEWQFAAALSFHYNTGAVLKTSWMQDFVAGDSVGARQFLENHYTNGGVLTARRASEAKLFFEGIWSPTNGLATVYPVLKPSYHPDWHHSKQIDIRADIGVALEAR
jgi:lysozyme